MKERLGITTGGPAALLAGVCWLAASCGDSGDQSAGASPVKPLGRSGDGSGGERDRAEEKVVTLYSWEDYLDPAVLQAFEAETGITVDYRSFGGTSELKSRLRSAPGDYDVLLVDDMTVNELKRLNLIRKLDGQALSNLGNLAAKYRQLEYDRGNAYTVPYFWGTTLVAYRTDRLPEADRSWSLLWDERLAGGRVMMMEESYDPISVALLREGLQLDATDPKDFQVAREALVEQIRTLDARFGDDADVREGLASGEIWAAMCYSGDAARVAEETEGAVDFFIPREGAPLWVDGFAIPRDAANPAAAHRFIDYMLRGEVAAKNAEYAWCATAVEAALASIDAELVEDERIFPPSDVLDRCSVLPEPDARRLKQVNMTWHATNKARAERAKELLKEEPSEVAAPEEGPDSPDRPL